MNSSIGLEKKQFVDLMKNVAESVWDFHERFDVEDIDFLSNKNNIKSLVYSRFGLQTEEMGEMARALAKGDFDNLREEIVDNLYVAMGTALVIRNSLINPLFDVLDKNDAKNPSNYNIKYYS